MLKALAVVLVLAVAGAALAASDAPAPRLPAVDAPGSPTVDAPRSPTADAPAIDRSRAARCPRGRTRWRAGHWPPACWRPYSSRSPFNRRIGAPPRLLEGSQRIVRRLAQLEPARLVAGGDSVRYGPPTYWPTSRDPLFRLHCTKPWGRCDIEGRRIRIPDAARPATGSDGHMTVIDQRSGWEYDLWQVSDKPRGGGQLSFAWGGRTRIDGDGLDSDATAARFGNLAGAVRAEELAAGRIRHALFITVPCDSGAWVYPARKGGTACADEGQSNVDAPPMGARLQLAMPEAAIDRLAAPAWQKAVLRAMVRYGMYVGDTGGSSWAIEQEGGLTYSSLGHADRWVALARRERIPYHAPTATWTFHAFDGVDWARYLRVLHPCEAQGTC